jgi:hypothetical protein
MELTKAHGNAIPSQLLAGHHQKTCGGLSSNDTESPAIAAIPWRLNAVWKTRNGIHAEPQENPVFGAVARGAGFVPDPDGRLRH